jgi:hypothetical protein
LRYSGTNATCSASRLALTAAVSRWRVILSAFDILKITVVGVAAGVLFFVAVVMIEQHLFYIH